MGQVALKFGANDFGSLMMEENVVSSAGTSFRLTLEEMRRLIREAGFEPRQRNNSYALIDVPPPGLVA
jgi:cyclic dehypoxanthinyl futalosine synthase